MWKKGFVTAHPEGKTGQELEAGTEAEITEDYFVLACSPGSLRFLS